MTKRILKHVAKDNSRLGANAAHRLAAAHALVCYSSDTVYTFIPKNACTTLRLSLAMANGCVADIRDWTWIHNNNGAFSASLRDLMTAKFTFVVLRCAHARLASVFLDKIVSLAPEFWTLHRLENDTLNPDTLTFRQFVDLIASPSRLRVDIHWRPQTDFLVYDSYDAYFALESLGTSIAEIEMRGGFEVVDARCLSRHGTDRFTRVATECFADTTMHEIRAMRRRGNLPTHTALYDADLVRRVAAIYSSDISIYCERFGTSNLTFPDC